MRHWLQLDGMHTDTHLISVSHELAKLCRLPRVNGFRIGYTKPAASVFHRGVDPYLQIFEETAPGVQRSQPTHRI